MALARTLAGHWWTLTREAQTRLAPPRLETSAPWSLELSDHDHGLITLTGALDEVRGADTLLVILHGLGGSAESSAPRRAAAAAGARGWSSLRVTMRGGDGRGEDLYHGGLVEDVARILDGPLARSHERVLLYGASLGGHISLRHALDPHPRLGAVAAVCPPIDLGLAVDEIDRGRAAPYRHLILASLKRSYRALAERRAVPSPPDEVDAVTHLRDWDRLVVVPRFGFGSLEDYYATMSVGPRLSELGVPSLYLGALTDPMIPFATVRPSLAASGPPLEARVRRRGGHLGFPHPVEGRVLDWLDAASGGAS